MTVLFADLKGSMELLADRDPEEARKLLDPVLERMMDAVHRYEGTVNQVMGDGIMALFGAPLAHEDHALRACYAALRMQETARSYADEVHRREGLPIQIRVGLNSGEVVVRSIGSDLRMDYTAVGQTTHLAARMEQMAVPGSILVSAATLNLVEGYVTVRALGVRNVKGLPEPVEVYELSSAAVARTRLQASAARGLTRFVGRSAEMEQLVDALALARKGQGQVVAVVGEPGVGKSRLYWELAHSHRTEGWLVLEASSVSYGKATPYLPVIDLLKRYFKLGDRDGHRESREKVTGKLLTLDEALQPALPAFLELLNVSVDDASWFGLEPTLRRQRTLQAVRHLLLRESRVQPVIVVFEDLHWIDSETQAFLNGLVESLTGARLLLLVNYRPEYAHGWGGKTHYRQLRVHPLPPESASELLDALVGDDSTLEPLKPLLMQQAEGTPLFLEETARALVETGALRGERGRYRLVKELRTVEIPPTVQAILAARIDRLPAEDKQLLQASSVIGKDVPLPLLQAISDARDEAIKSGLARLQAAEFLYETSLFPDLEFTFKHALTHDVAYGSLLQERRRELHARVARAIERLYADRRTDWVERLADHVFRGESWEQAVDYLREAGAKAVARATVREAVGHLERALVALAHLPTSPTRVETGIDIRLDLRNCLYLIGEHSRTLDHLRTARDLAAQTGDLIRLARATGYLATTFMFLGDNAEALEEATRARELASEARRPELEVEMQQRATQVHFLRGEFADGTRLLTDVVRVVESGGPAPRWFGQILTSVQARTSLASALGEQGDFTAASRAAEHALAEAERQEHRYSEAVALTARGGVYVRQGEFEAAQPFLERGLELSRELELSLTLAGVAAFLGLVYVRRGRSEAGLALLEEFRERRFAMGGPVHVFLAEGYLVAGRPHEARTAALRVAEEARQRSEMAVVARASVVIGGAAALEPATASQALEAYRGASDIAERLGLRPLLAHCHLGVGRLYRRTGKQPEAQEHLTTATTMYREMDMRFWLEQAEAEMSLMA
ncbi:MAG TPA: adenylate/guanylate cyclase domain-containing protein [Methylomirabilota bacterium]|nr:adenylate/guanylate cyclase domain-containing protein [Methylomirabilota bacterium]